MPGIASHSFAQEGHAAREAIRFREGPALEVHQHGCDSVEQVFTWYFGRDQKIRDLAGTAAERFRFLGSLDTSLQMFYLWASTIEEHATEFRQRAPLEVGPSVFIALDQVKTAENQEFRITLTQTR